MGTPIFDPQGQVRDVSDDQVQNALANGGIQALPMIAPDGSRHYVRPDEMKSAIAAGGTPYSGTAVTIDPTEAANQALRATGIKVGAPPAAPISPELQGAPSLTAAARIQNPQQRGQALQGRFSQDLLSATGPTVPVFQPPTQSLPDIASIQDPQQRGAALQTHFRQAAYPFTQAAQAALPTPTAGLQGPDVIPGQFIKAATGRANNLAAAAEAGGKGPGVTRVYEDLAEPGAQEFANAAARENVRPSDFKGRTGPDKAVQVANRMQQDAEAQAQPYFDQVNNRPLHWSQVPNPAGGTMTLGDSVRAQIAPLRDALPSKLVTAIDNAQTVGDLNEIRKELNSGGGRYFNAATDTQFAATESQRAMADAGNIMRDAVYGEVGRVAGPDAATDVRRIKQMEGNAINLRTQFEKAGHNLSGVASAEGAPPTYWQQIRAGKSGVEMGKAAVGITPPTTLDIFNTRMQRAIRGGNPTPARIASFPSAVASQPPTALPSAQGGYSGTPGGVPTSSPGSFPTVPGYQTGTPTPAGFTPPGYQLGSVPPPVAQPYVGPEVGQPYGLRIEPQQLQRGPIITPPPAGGRPAALPPGRTPLQLPGTPPPRYVEPTPTPISRLLSRKGVPATRR